MNVSTKMPLSQEPLTSNLNHPLSCFQLSYHHRVLAHIALGGKVQAKPCRHTETDVGGNPGMMMMGGNLNIDQIQNIMMFSGKSLELGNDVFRKVS